MSTNKISASLVINRHTNNLIAKINDKEIKMTVEEFAVMKMLVDELVHDYTQTAYAAYLDRDKIITIRDE